MAPLYCFWQGNSPLSNFWQCPTPFSWACAGDSVAHQWPTSEHAFAYAKAMMFGDDAKARAILEAARTRSDPLAAKRLGRGVAMRGGVDRWDATRNAVMRSILDAKFADVNSVQSRALLATGSATLVEASPHDAYWGAGMTARDVRACGDDHTLWRGLNTLGRLLQLVRDDLVRRSANK